MEEQRRRKLKHKNRWADVLAAIILCGALILGIVALRDFFRAKMLNFANVEEGSVVLTLSAELLVLRHEYVVTAPSAGHFNPQIEEGARVKEGTLLGYCGNNPVYAPKGGEISYELDGWEEKLQIAAFHELDWLKVFTQLKEEQNQAKADEVAEEPTRQEEEAELLGRPLARVVDNLLDYTVLLKLQDEHQLLAEESHITFHLTKEQIISAAYQERWQTPEGDIYYIFNKISSKEDTLFKLRYCATEIIAREVSGIILPSSAIILDEEGDTGVFIRKKRKLVFTKIDELAVKDDICVVKGLDNMAVVVVNPNRAKDGQRI